MAITGGIKFFSKSLCNFADGASAVASSGQSAANYAIDRNVDTIWRSVSSNDLTVETLEIDFGQTQTINRLFLINHNFKQFTAKYDVSGSWTDFSSVVGIDGALGGGISESIFSDDTAYYEFSNVSTSKIQLTITKTQTANQDKFLTQAIATLEIGTLQGHPQKTVTINKNERQKAALSGRLMIVKSVETFSCTLNFKNYPGRSPYGNDFDILMTLFDQDDNFLIWLCGGRRGLNYFSYQPRGYRLRDIYTVQVSKQIAPSFPDNVYSNSISMTIDFAEAI